MITKTALRTILADQAKERGMVKGTIPRSALQAALSYKGASALVIKGVRRCGKSTLLQQMIAAGYEDVLYFNFDDERISGFRAEDFQALMETLIEAYGVTKNVFFDEIQNIRGWELFVNRLLRQGYRVVITGSNASLLSRELGTHLTGRHMDMELYPFSFAEFLKAQKIDMPRKGFYSTEQRALLSGKFNEYVSGGGMPEAVVFSNAAILTQVLTDIIQKDIITRYGIRKPAELKTVLKFLVANAGNQITYRSIQNNFSIKSPNTIQKYIGCAEESYIIFLVRKFEKKIKLIDKSPKKVYCIDNGIITKNAPAALENRGALLENVVAVHLRRLGKEFCYFKTDSGAEADFVAPLEKEVIQVCYEMTSENEERELRGLIEAMRELKVVKGTILTLEQEQEMTHKGRKIKIRPVWQWLLENEPL